MRRMPPWSQKIEVRTFPFLHLEYFGGGVSCYAATTLIVALSPGHRFRPWSPFAPDRKSFGSRRKNSKSFSDDWHRWRFLSAFRHFGTHLTESFRMSKSSWMTDPTRSREMPSCSAINLAEVRRSSKISSWIWSIISGVVTVLSRPERDASHVEKSPRLTWATQSLTVAYDGACSPNVCVRMACISFGALPCRGGKNFMKARFSMLLKLRALPEMLHFNLCNKKRLSIRHMNRPFFPTTLSIPSYDIGK